MRKNLLLTESSRLYRRRSCAVASTAGNDGFVHTVAVHQDVPFVHSNHHIFKLPEPSAATTTFGFAYCNDVQEGFQSLASPNKLSRFLQFRSHCLPYPVRCMLEAIYARLQVGSRSTEPCPKIRPCPCFYNAIINTYRHVKIVKRRGEKIPTSFKR